MPDYQGRMYDDVYVELASLNASITRRTQVSTSRPGTIIGQDPVAGAPFQQAVTLTVSVEAPVVPDVVGMQFGDAEAKLTEIGLRSIEVPEFDEKKVDGLVVAQDPPKGAKNKAEVRLSVVRRPVEVYLADMETVGSSNIELSTGSAQGNGEDYAHALAVRPDYRSAPGTIEYNLSRDYRKLVSAVTLSDSSPSDARYKLEIRGDRRELLKTAVDFGEDPTPQIEVDVTDVLRLRITVSVNTDTDQDATLVLGDIRVQGLESEVPTPSASPT